MPTGGQALGLSGLVVLPFGPVAARGEYLHGLEGVVLELAAPAAPGRAPQLYVDLVVPGAPR